MTDIEIEVSAIVNISVDEVWPDGDAPAEVTPEAVKEAMESAGSKGSVLKDWQLLEDCQVIVYVDGKNGSQMVSVW